MGKKDRGNLKMNDQTTTTSAAPTAPETSAPQGVVNGVTTPETTSADNVTEKNAALPPEIAPAPTTVVPPEILNPVQTPVKPQAAPVVTPPPVVQQTKPVVDTAPAQAPDLSKISTTAKLALMNIDEYIANMQPSKPITVENGCKNQVTLFRSITQILNHLNEDFNVVYSEMLRKVHEHSNGVFYDANVFRFFDNISLNEKERKQFQRLLNLLKLTADPKSRQVALKQVDLGKTLEFFPESVKQKILTFYRV